MSFEYQCQCLENLNAASGKPIIFNVKMSFDHVLYDYACLFCSSYLIQGLTILMNCLFGLSSYSTIPCQCFKILNGPGGKNIFNEAKFQKRRECKLVVLSS